NLCYRMLGEPEAAEDAAQEVFLRVFRNIWRYNAERPFGTWLMSIAAHYCIDRLRRRKLAFFSMDEEPEMELPDRNAPDPEKETMRSEDRQRLHELLQRLEPLDRAALTLRYWNDCSEIEIAETLHLTVSAVKSRLHRARRAVAKLWQEEKQPGRTERIAYGSPAI
ncbi:MAG: sigma-70 family RNA polymerase sigma factor, partial [Chloroflexi bacterium]|nr:sigma-70 family RNA polymerase sigma factor [Chloroflexota bacterium]